MVSLLPSRKESVLLSNSLFLTFHYLILEVGCRGFIPSRFFPMLRQLGFASRESRRLHNSLQLIARRCSYIIWVNRYNRDFRPFRFTEALSKAALTSAEAIRAEKNRLSALAILQKKRASSVPLPLTSDQFARATRNRALALVVRAHKTVTAQAARAQKNRQKALAILQSKKRGSVWKAKLQPSPPSTPIASTSISDNLNLWEMKDQKLRLLWKLPVDPGLALKNTLNKCWFHSPCIFLLAFLSYDSGH